MKPGYRMVDATVGDGGHATALLETTAPDGRLLGIDADPGALERARARLAHYGERVTLINDNFANLQRTVEEHRFQPLMAVLMDLGLSSWQLEAAGRGFSFRENVPLDMRFSPEQPLRAEEIVNRYPLEDLARVIATYGEEPQARRIAASIVRHRPIRTAQELAKTIESAAPRRGRHIHPATRTFQALRIFVNQELENLEAGLRQAVAVLAKGGRLAVIAYHSLEDRLVKAFFRQEARDCLCPPRQPVCTCGHRASVALVTKRAVRPSKEEVLQNPRVRSARLRACQRLAPGGAG